MSQTLVYVERVETEEDEEEKSPGVRTGKKKRYGRGGITQRHRSI